MIHGDERGRTIGFPTANIGVTADRARVSGGGSRGLWLEIVAAVLGLPLERTAADEGSAFGAALLGGVAGGLFPDVHAAVASCTRVTATVEPDPAWVRAYEDVRPRFLALHPALDRVGKGIR